MRTRAMKLFASVGVVILASPLTTAHADGQYGDIKPGAVLRHVEHLSQNSRKGWAVSASADGRTVAVGGPVQNAHGFSFGHVDVWVLTSAGWTLHADLSSPVTSARLGDDFGLAVSLSSDGQHLAVGDRIEPFDQEDLWYGAVYTYTRTATGWSSPTTIDSPDQAYEGQFGSSVALNADGSELIAGAPDDGILGGTPPGAAWAFVRTGGGWGKAQSLAPAADQPQRFFGDQVAISADGRLAAVTNSTVTVGGAAFAGDVIVFARASNGSWTQTSVLTHQPPVPQGQFGSSVAMSTDGSTIAVGAVGFGSSATSRVLVYRRAGTAWTRSATFVYAPSAYSSDFGSAVALSANGDVLAVGAPYRTKGTVVATGGVYRYHWTGSSWSYLGATFVRGAGTGELDGWSVALSGDAGRLFIGAPGYRRPGAHPSLTGATYVVG